jgi:hypothetical protein
MTGAAEGLSFYFFDFDHNIMFLATPILIRNTVTREVMEISTGEFANVQPRLGQPGKWGEYAVFDGSFSHFRDVPASQLQPGQKQRFVEDVDRATKSDDGKWKGPSWNLFAYACEKQRSVSIVTARGHDPETMKAGIRVLAEKDLIVREPNYHTVFPVGNDEVRRAQLGDCDLIMTTPALKKAAIIKSVEKALVKYGSEPKHRFGMSDDDPNNVRLIISAIRDCKKQNPGKRFFVIDTNYDENVKLEVFPVDMPVTSNPNLAADGPLK